MGNQQDILEGMSDRCTVDDSLGTKVGRRVGPFVGTEVRNGLGKDVGSIGAIVLVGSTGRDVLGGNVVSIVGALLECNGGAATIMATGKLVGATLGASVDIAVSLSWSRLGSEVGLGDSGGTAGVAGFRYIPATSSKLL